MPKTFNTAGPCRPELHYMLPPERRLEAIPPLIEEHAFFVVHAPRQTGKTTSFHALARSLTGEGRYAAIHASLKPAAIADGDVALGIDAAIRAVPTSARQQLPKSLRPRPVADFDSESPAKEALILRRDTHIDSLVERLREPRIRRVVEPILAGRFPEDDVLDDDVQFAKDLGLVARDVRGLEIANPIYREIVPRALAAVTEEVLPVVRDPYVAADGRLLFDDLLDGLAAFWRQHAEHFLHRQPYSEAAAQLIFMAYLQRVVNGGSPAGVASIDREYAIGSGRIDLSVRWPLATGEVERFAVELKVWRDREADPLEAGLDQLAGYLDRLGLDRGTLVLFDSRSDAPPLPDRVDRSEREHGGRRITVWRM